MNSLLKSIDVKEAISFVKTVALLLVLAVFLRGTVIEAFKIPSASMRPTLREGDHILVSKLSFGLRAAGFPLTLVRWAEPSRGDIVVFTRHDDPRTFEDESDVNVIKRVIAIAGDKIEVRGTSVYLNDERQVEPYARWEEGGIEEGYFGPVVVPPGRVLLLGDNRDHSKDSRFWHDPFLDISRVKGRALVIYWCWEDFWQRMFKIVR